MDCLVGYGSDEDYETEYRDRRRTGLPGSSGRRKEDDTNYDDVNMDMSEDSQAEESEPELPQAEPVPSHDEDRHFRANQRRSPNHRRSPDHRDMNHRSPSNRDRDDHRDNRRRSPPGRGRGDRDKRDKSPRRDERKDDRRDDRRHRSERSRHESGSSSRRGLLGDKPEDKTSDNNKMPALMDLKPFGGEPPPSIHKSHDTRDAVSPRFVDRREKDKDRERDRDRHNRRSEEKSRRSERRSRSRDRGDRGDKGLDHRNMQQRPTYRPNHPSTNEPGEKRMSPSNEFRPSTSYKVNKKLEVMEKMGLQIKTPDGSMATAQQLRQAATEPMAPRAPLPYCNPTTNTARMLDQVQKRKLLWANKTADKAPWTGTTFAQDNDGKQANKFMRLMGIKEPEAIPPKPEKVDPNKKQEEMFQAMQAQYDVARATTHTMRGVGLGFQRGPF